MSKVQRSLVGNENKVLFTVNIIRQFIFSWNVLNVWYWTTKYKMHLKLGARIENRMLARISHLWSLSVNVDLFDHSEAFSLVKRKGTQKPGTICMCYTYSTFRSKHQTLYDPAKNIELFWNIKSACRSKQIIMDLVTLCGIIHVYMHVLCLVAPSADQFFFLACLSHSKIWIFANLCQLYG